MNVFNGLRKQSALHRDGCGPFRTDPQPLREFQPQAMQQSRLGCIGTHDAPEAQLATIRGRQNDIRALDASQFVQDRARAPAQPAAAIAPTTLNLGS